MLKGWSLKKCSFLAMVSKRGGRNLTSARKIEVDFCRKLLKHLTPEELFLSEFFSNKLWHIVIPVLLQVRSVGARVESHPVSTTLCQWHSSLEDCTLRLGCPLYFPSPCPWGFPAQPYIPSRLSSPSVQCSRVVLAPAIGQICYTSLDDLDTFPH